MKKFLRPGWLVLAIGLILALAFVLIPGRRAQAFTGAPAITVVLTQTTGTTKIDVSGVYSDPEGVCAISGKTVDIVVRNDNSTGTIRKSFTSGPTTAGGAYGPTTTPGTPLGAGTYWVQASVTGSLAGGYGAGDACPNVSNNNTITLT